MNAKLSVVITVFNWVHGKCLEPGVKTGCKSEWIWLAILVLWMHVGISCLWGEDCWRTVCSFITLCCSSCCLLGFVLVFCWERISLCSLGYHITSLIDQTFLRSLSAFILPGLKLKYTHGVCSAESSFNLWTIEFRY